MTEVSIRCTNCNKLLANKTAGYTRLLKESVMAEQVVDAIDDDHCIIHIKCPRCKAMNHIKV